MSSLWWKVSVEFLAWNRRATDGKSFDNVDVELGYITRGES